MSGFSHDQKIALLVVPVLLFGILGVGGATSSITREAGTDMRRPQVYGSREMTHSTVSEALRSALHNKDYGAFVHALQNTPYAEYTKRDVFDALVHAYELHVHGDGHSADDHFIRVLYS